MFDLCNVLPTDSLQLHVNTNMVRCYIMLTFTYPVLTVVGSCLLCPGAPENSTEIYSKLSNIVSL